MPDYRFLEHRQPFYGSWLDALQEFLAGATPDQVEGYVDPPTLSGIKLFSAPVSGVNQANVYISGASWDAGAAGSSGGAIAINGLWRYRSDVAVIPMSTGSAPIYAAGTYDCYVVCSANEYNADGTDTTDYQWYPVLVTSGGAAPTGNTPAGKAIAATRLVGTVVVTAIPLNASPGFTPSTVRQVEYRPADEFAHGREVYFRTWKTLARRVLASELLSTSPSPFVLSAEPKVQFSTGGVIAGSSPYLSDVVGLRAVSAGSQPSDVFDGRRSREYRIRTVIVPNNVAGTTRSAISISLYGVTAPTSGIGATWTRNSTPLVTHTYNGPIPAGQIVVLTSGSFPSPAGSNTTGELYVIGGTHALDAGCAVRLYSELQYRDIRVSR